MKTWANGGGGASALALLAGVSGAGAVALTVATIKKKMECVQRFLQRLYGFTEYLHLMLRFSSFTDRLDVPNSVAGLGR